MPRPPFLRVTVKGLGDQSKAVAHLKPGTRVFIEGPYGTFTRYARTQDRVALIGAGVGITPLRALLEDLPKDVHVSVVIRASSPDDIVHRDEVKTLVDMRGGEFHELVGSRKQVAFDHRMMRRLLPNISHSDVYVCGPSGFTDHVVSTALRQGVDPKRIHHEAFSF
jgi:ferredoxin-NADP reductase